jgi:hypothetical protein
VAQDQHGESHFGKAQVRNVDGPKMSMAQVPKCRYSSGSSDQRGRVAPDPRDHDFTTQRFEHGAQ